MEKSGTILKYDPVESHMWNFIVDPKFREGVDFEVVSAKIWNFFSQYHSLYNPENTLLEKPSLVTPQ